ncbi:MAG: DUF4174 domain-containing protein [Opitutales bacterium]
MLILTLLFCALLAATASAQSADGTPANTDGEAESIEAPTSKVLDRYLWKHRVLLIFSPSTSDPAYRFYLEELERLAPLWTERDLLIGQFVSGQGGAIAGDFFTQDQMERIRADFGLPKDSLASALVGKDGRVKLQMGAPIPLTKLVSLIDSMPLRRAEMARATEAAAEQNGEVEPEPSKPASSFGAPRTYEALAAAFLDAHERQDMLAVMELVYMEDAPPFIRQQLVRSFEADFAKRIERIRIEPPRKDQVLEYTYRGTRYITTLPVAANMVLEYAVDESTPPSTDPNAEAEDFTGTTYPVGIKNGRFYLVTAKAAPNQENL